MIEQPSTKLRERDGEVKTKMKRRHLLTLVAFSLVAIMFVATAAALSYNCVITSAVKAGKDFTIQIDTSSGVNGSATITSFGNSVNRNSIYVTVYDNKNNPTTIGPLDSSRVTIVNANLVEIKLVKQDGIPSQSSTLNVVGDLLSPYAGNTFFASGPGWGWGTSH